MFLRLGGLPAALVLLACTALVLPAGGPALGQEPVPAPSGPPLGGVNIGGLGYESKPSEADHAARLAHELGAKVVRVELPWSAMEPRAQNSIAPAALAYTDRMVADAAADGMTVILMVRSTPCWASSAPPSLLKKCSPIRETAANAWPPRAPADYGSFMAFLAKRYGTRLAALEVWNEPDQANQEFFAGPEKPARYAALVRAAYPAVKQANPAVTVLAGSIVGSNGHFLSALYAAGIKGYYDGLAVHFYTLTVAALRSIREVQLANGDSKPLWLDEFGWSSCLPKHRVQAEQPCVTRQLQATNIANVFRTLAHVPYVAAAVLYKLTDSADGEFGLYTARGARKPSFAALAAVLKSPFGALTPVSLELRRTGGGLVASGSAPVGDFMELEAFQGNTPRYRALFVLNKFNAYSITLPKVLGTSGLRVRIFQYGAAGKAAQSSA
jgi:hypothetical protein